MRHALDEKSTPEQKAAAQEAADWLLDGIATATQDRRFLRGEPEYDDLVGEAILANGRIAALRAIHNLTPTRATSEADALRAENERLRSALERVAPQVADQ